MQCANDKIRFVHNDFHTKNILVTTHRDVRKTKLYWKGKIVEVDTRFVLYIIDTEFSNVMIPNTNTLCKYEGYDAMLRYNSNDITYDIIKILMYFHTVDNLSGYIDKLWGYYSKVPMKKLRKALYNNYYFLPDVFPNFDETKPLSGLLDIIVKDTIYPSEYPEIFS